MTRASKELRLEPPHGFDARRAGERLEAAAAEPFRQRLGHVDVVVDDEDADQGGSGRRIHVEDDRRLIIRKVG